MIHLETGQKLITTDQTVVTGGDYDEEEIVVVINSLGQTAGHQAYYIAHGVVYAERIE